MIEFQGLDIVVRHRPEDGRVRLTLAEATGVTAERVALITDMADYPDATSADVVCVSSPLEGEFEALLSIQSGSLTLPYDTYKQLVQRLCDLLDTPCLMPDDEQNSYLMWLISPRSEPYKIALDAAAFDDGRYVVSQIRP